jgi:hypothetical protein
MENQIIIEAAKRLQIGEYFVVANGKDCDGYNRGRVQDFPCKEFAEIYADNSNEWSDGIHYSVVDECGFIDYCKEFDKLYSYQIAFTKVKVKKFKEFLENSILQNSIIHLKVTTLVILQEFFDEFFTTWFMDDDALEEVRQTYQRFEKR